MKRTEPKSFAQIFDEGLARVGMTDTMARHRACYIWPEIVGPGVNKHTFKRYVADDGVLHVYLTSAVLKQELSFHRRRLVEQINAAVGSNAIIGIEFH